MRWIKDIIVPFRSCRKSTTAAVLAITARKHRATAPATPLVAGSSDDDDEKGAGAASAPHIVLRMHLHCASCAAKIERVVMDIPGVEKVATDVAASRFTVTGTADAAAVVESVQVRTRKPVTVVRDGRTSAQERSGAAAARTPRGVDRARPLGEAAAAQVPVPERAAARHPEAETAGRHAQEQAAEWTAEVRIAGLHCGRCVGRMIRRVARFQGVREIKLTLPDRATTRYRRSSSSSSRVCGNPRKNQRLLGPA